MVVPVDVALGRGTPCAWSARFRLWLLKSKPGIVCYLWYVREVERSMRRTLVGEYLVSVMDVCDCVVAVALKHAQAPAINNMASGRQRNDALFAEQRAVTSKSFCLRK